MPFSLGALPDKKDERDNLFGSIISPVTLPPVVDYELKMTSVKNQYKRGSCVAFATCAMKEYQETKQSGTPVDLSEEFLYDNVGSPSGGAEPRVAMDFLVKKGVCPDRLWPYNKTASDMYPPSWIPWVASKHRPLFIAAMPYKAQGYTRLVSEQDMMQSLLMNGPFVLCVSWQTEWFTPKTKDADGYPILKPLKGQDEGGHALCCCGYDQKARTFKFKNSWGPTWGRNGYAKFTFDTISNNLNDAWASFDLAHPQVIQSAIHGANLLRTEHGLDALSAIRQAWQE